MPKVFRYATLWPLRYRYKVDSLCAIHTPSHVHYVYLYSVQNATWPWRFSISLAIFTSSLFTCQAISTLFFFFFFSFPPFSHVVPSRCDSVLYRSERKKGSRKSLLCHSCSQSSRTSVNGKCVCDVHTVHLHTRRGYSRVTFVSRTTLHSCAFLPKKAVYS